MIRTRISDRAQGGLRIPIAVLFALLQRSPVVRLACLAFEALADSPISSIIRYTTASLATLGTIDALAGATVFTLTTGTPGHPSPYMVTAGTAIEPVAFAITNTSLSASEAGSWAVGGSFPPGLRLGNGSSYLTGSGGIKISLPELFGTPTTPGDYTLTLQPYMANLSGQTAGIFYYEVRVLAAAAATEPPMFTIQPASVSVGGGTVALNAVANDAPTYQWYLNGTVLLPGATDSTLLMSNAAAGSYTCVASNAAGSTTSEPAVVSLSNSADIGRLVNISCRAQVGTGSAILIAGFAVGGQGTSGSERLLLRASGPALVPFGVAGAIPDPALAVINSSNEVIGVNDGWAANGQIASAAAAVGAFAWTDPASADAAVIEDLPSGAYTAQVSGESGDTGVALAEVYDATPPGTYTSASPRLVNISARVQVGAGGNVLIAGFVIGGTTSRTVLIRASGPALASYGVTGTLPDPQLGLFSGDTELMSNDGWGGVSEISGAARQVGAFAWSTNGSNDSAILTTLPPGAYTVQVSGASGDGGVALIEIYEVP
jgi:Immunoglobulin domain